MNQRIVLCIALALAGGVVGMARGASVGADANSDLAHDVISLIRRRCAECHTNGKYQGKLSLDTRQAILRSGVATARQHARSRLFLRIISSDSSFRMPPKGDPLTKDEIDLIARWIDEGLPWPEGFSFLQTTYTPPLKLRRPDLPPARDGNHQPIDRLVEAYRARHKLRAFPALDDATFLRRVYLDLIGLLPPVEALQSFLADPSADKRERIIQRLLNDRRSYADHWLTFWNDLLRNDYQGTGYIDGGRKQITAWLYQSLLDNKPYDRFVRELISPNVDSEGFVNGIKWRGRVNASQTREVQFAQNVSQVFLGINMKCASCHDSFVDSWKLDDAYGLAAIVAEGPLEIHRCDKPTGKQAVARFIFPELGAIDGSQPRARRLEQLSLLITSPDNGRLARTMVNRLWHKLMGRGLVHPVDAMGTRPWDEDLLDYLASYFIDNGYDAKRLIEHIVTSRTYQSQTVSRGREIGAGEEYVFRGPEVKRMTAEQFLDAVWMITWSGPAKVVPAVPLPVDDRRPLEHRFVRACLVNADALMRSLGRPNREQVVTARGDQLTTLQALDLSNGQSLHDLVTQGAARLLKENPGGSAEALIQSTFEKALSRQPTAKELTVASQLIGSPPQAAGLADFLWSVFMMPEFQLVR